MEKFYQKGNKLEEKHPRINDVYIPNWAQTLIDLYTSPLKYEVMREMRDSESSSYDHDIVNTLS
jgi:hypothetical protein